MGTANTSCSGTDRQPSYMNLDGGGEHRQGLRYAIISRRCIVLVHCIMQSAAPPVVVNQKWIGYNGASDRKG